MSRIETILTLYAAENTEEINDLQSKWKSIVSKSPLVNEPEKFLKDGWGGDYEVVVEQKDGDIAIKVYSKNYENYERKKKS